MNGLIAAFFRAVDAVTVDLWKNIRQGLRDLWDGPLQGLVFGVVLAVTGGIVIAETLGRWFERVLGAVERSLVSLAMLAMTLLAFNEYLARELRPSLGDLGGLWSLEGQMNMALLLMVVVGFMGASIATRDRKHIAVDALGRVLAPAAARTVRRGTNLGAAGLCWLFARGAWDAVFSHSQDAFEGARVWSVLTGPINALVSWMPGEKFGPLSCAEHGSELAARLAAGCPPAEFTSSDAWIDAKYDAGLDPFDLFAFGYVDAGDRFPLWIPLILICGTFALMSLRFAVHALYPDGLDDTVPGIPPVPPGTRRPVDVILAGAMPGALLTLGLAVWLGQGWMILLSAILLAVVRFGLAEEVPWSSLLEDRVSWPR